MNTNPLVSIIIPSYNHSQFIRHAIQSIIDQSYENIELIIIDDGSKDESIKVIQEMIPVCKSRFKQFEFRFRSNRGLSSTLNEGISLAKGDLIGFCSSDDLFHALKVFTQVTYFNKHKDINFCYTQAYVQDDIGNVLDKATELLNIKLNENVTFDDVFTFKVHFPVTGMYRAHFLKHVLNGFDENLTAEDYDINLRILSIGGAGYINKKLYYYRSPAAIGSGRIRPVMRKDVSESHLSTINKYRSHPRYEEAILEWNFRRFMYFSAYRKTKIYSFVGMLKSLPKFKSIYFYKSVLRLFFYWR